LLDVFIEILFIHHFIVNMA